MKVIVATLLSLSVGAAFAQRPETIFLPVQDAATAQRVPVRGGTNETGLISEQQPASPHAVFEEDGSGGKAKFDRSRIAPAAEPYAPPSFDAGGGATKANVPLARPSPASDLPEPPKREAGPLPVAGDFTAPVPDPESEVRFDREIELPIRPAVGSARGGATPVPGFGGDNTVPGGVVGSSQAPRTPVSGAIERMTADILAGKASSHLQAKPGTTEIVPIAKGKLNRIVTPFDEPQGLTSTAGTKVEVQGRSLFVVTNAEEPVDLFITDGRGEQAITATLIPSDIPPREIFISLSPSSAPPGFASAPSSTEKADSHAAAVVETMRELAQNRIPVGYAMGKAADRNVPRCAQRGFAMQLGQILEGAETRIAVYLATNTLNHEVQLDEQSCYRKGVVGVSAWPELMVPALGQTELYVMYRRESEPEGNMGRPSLLGRGSIQ